MNPKRMKIQERKYSFGTVRGIADDVEQTRTVEFVASTSTKDRHGTVLNQKNWKLDNFNKNGIIGYQHNVYGGNLCSPEDPDDVIGKGFAFVEDDQLIVRVTFEPADINPKAEKIFRKVLHGSLRATSVGFLEVGEGKWGEGEEAKGRSQQTYYFDGQELLELSIVNIPSNPDAVGRSIRNHTANALMFVKRALGEEYSFSDIERMTVSELLRLMEKGKRHLGEEQGEDEREEEAPKPVDYSRYEKHLKLLSI